MNSDMALMMIWIGFLIVGCTAAGSLFFWGIRTRQFGDQERARSLPLEAAIPMETPPEEKGEGDNG